MADARYLYFWHGCNYFIIGGYRTAHLSSSLAGDNHTWTLNIIVYGVTPPLSASSNAAFDNFFSSHLNWGTYSSSSNTQTVYNTTNTLYTWTAYFNAVQTPGNHNAPYRSVWPNIVYIRYDTYANFNSSSSYSWTLGPNSLPLSIKDAFPGDYDTFQIPEVTYLFESSFDGRYIYTAQAQGPQGTGVLRQDTQNFLANTFTRGSQYSLSPFPIGNMIGYPFISDGRYTYVADIVQNWQGGWYDGPGDWYFKRYDNTKSINSPSSWESYFDNSGYLRSWAFEFHIPIGFDGKNVYYMASDIRGPSGVDRLISIYVYDTTQPFTSSSSWKWLDFRRDGTVNASDGSHPNINLIIPENTPQFYSSVGGFYAAVGSRYVYFISLGGNTYWPYNNFITYNPLTMTQSFDASVLVKYEKYDQPRQFSKSLFGQTDVNEFTILSGQRSGNFQLEFSGPVRELWISPDVPVRVSHVTLRINNEILIDDDQPVSRFVRAYESHTNMPTGNLYMYNFALDPEKLAPSGTLNMSRTPYPMLEIKLTSVAASNTKIRVYAKNFNVLETRDGLGGLAFSSTT